MFYATLPQCNGLIGIESNLYHVAWSIQFIPSFRYILHVYYTLYLYFFRFYTWSRLLKMFKRNPNVIIFDWYCSDVSNISVKIGKNGWSLLVNDQKLFIWSHQSGSSKVCVIRVYNDKLVWVSRNNYDLEAEGRKLNAPTWLSDTNFELFWKAIYCNF